MKPKNLENFWSRKHKSFLGLKKGEWILLIFTAAYILAYSVYYLSIKNYEFIWYILVLLIFFVLIAVTLRKSGLDYIALWGLSLWGLLHMSGGGLIVNGDVLYALEIIKLFNVGDTYVLKFDQFVHFFGFGVTTIVAYQLLVPRLNKNANYKLIYPLLFLIAMGAGAMNEIVEFVAVIASENNGVGGYFNTALDLVSNGVGSIIALFFIHFYYRHGK